MVEGEWDTSPAKSGSSPKVKSVHAMHQIKMPAWQVFTVLNFEPSVDAKLVVSDKLSTISSSGEVGPRLKLDEEMKSNYGRRLHKNRLRTSQRLGLLESALESVRSDFQSKEIPMLDIVALICGEANAINDAVSIVMVRNNIDRGPIGGAMNFMNDAEFPINTCDAYSRGFSLSWWACLPLGILTNESPLRAVLPFIPDFTQNYFYFSLFSLCTVQSVSFSFKRFHDFTRRFNLSRLRAISRSGEVVRFSEGLSHQSR